MKVRRKQAILDLINKEVVTTQAEISTALARQGFKVTQATVSRDIKELGLVKVPMEGNSYRYAMAENSGKALPKDRLHRLLRDNVLKIEGIENLILIKTMPGGAQALASALDSAMIQNVAGTIAGDDTILIIVREKQQVEELVDSFNEIIGAQ